MRAQVALAPAGSPQPPLRSAVDHVPLSKSSQFHFPRVVPWVPQGPGRSLDSDPQPSSQGRRRAARLHLLQAPHGAVPWQPAISREKRGARAARNDAANGANKRNFKGTFIVSDFRAARRTPDTRKNDLFYVQNKQVFECLKSTTCSRGFQGKSSFFIEPSAR